MAVPKRRHSKQRSGKRKISKKIKLAQMTKCKKCGSVKLSHRICKKCNT